MIKSINNRSDAIEKKNATRAVAHKIASPPPQKYIINRLIAEKRELMTEVHWLKKIAADHLPTKKNNIPKTQKYAEKLAQYIRTQTKTRSSHQLPAPQIKQLICFRKETS
ncbi:hypothetical protein O181_040149 [Austropuccinia psidii MF-1]|uniref:Uncharacterized protein n=1 Tax=Austropuccinia psidii MF-1 TaxID=1389203 RepID=A0A9Q3DBP0_9BASI|nr:hypothetical protein [Austropuccinia psidii MF-1]